MRQWSLRSISVEGWLVILLVLLGLALRFYYAWQPLPILIEQGISDDAFYYLNIAKNIVLGRGISFDGLMPTNGFHPLFLSLLVPLFIINPISNTSDTIIMHNLELNTQLSLCILMVFNAITAFPLYGILKKVSSHAAGFISVIIWLFNPWVLVISLAGVETAPYLFFVALTSFFYISIQGRNPTPTPITNLIILGFLSGITMLARSDGVFLFLAILLDMSLCKQKPSKILYLLVSFGVVVMPWFIWNYITFGSITQVSGLSVYQHTHFGLVSSWKEVLATLLQSTGRMFVVSAIVNYPIFFIVIMFCIVSVFPRYKVKPSQNSETNRMRFLFFYALMIFGFYAWYLLRKQFWYFMPLIFVASIWAGLMHERFIHSLRSDNPVQKNIFTAMVAGVLMVTFGLGWWVWQSRIYSIYPAERNGYLLSQWIRTETESGARIGSWNSGIIGYLSDRTVINLDGVVNNNLYNFVKEKKVSFYDLSGIWDYIKESQIEYLTDYEYILSDEIIPQFNAAGGGGKLKLVYQFPSVQSQEKYPVQVYVIH